VQVLNAPPRDDLTADQVRALLTGDGVEISAGLELLDSSNRFVDDISDALVVSGSTIDHDGRATQVHRSCVLQLQQALAWGRDRVQVYVTLSNAAVAARFNVGVFVLTTPQTKRNEDPITYEVHGYDLLQPLLDSPGDTYVVIPEDGDEMVSNTGFESGVAGWESNSMFGTMPTSTFTQSALHPSAGTKSMKITWSAGDRSWVNTFFTGLVVGKTYRFSADLWVPADGPDDFKFSIAFLESSPWFTPVKEAHVHIEWLWTATTTDDLPRRRPGRDPACRRQRTAATRRH
jgi:hypothetical protein